MELEFNADQKTFLGVLGQMLDASDAEFRTVENWIRFEYGDALDAQLQENGFFDAAGEADLGPVAAAAMVFQAAQVPVGLECAASALLRPSLGLEVPRPLAVVVDNAPGAIRYLPVARALVSITDAGVRLADLPEGSVRAVDSLFAYPMGEVDRGALQWRDLPVDAGDMRRLWQVAVAAELTGVMQGALDAVLRYVRERSQFGQPLGSFQAVQHRLSINAVEVDAARLLMLKAAQSLAPQDCALALGYVQGFARRLGYDLHQFMGAMGLTLEHPLHRWTYRARLLRAEMGGTAAALGDYGDARWGAVGQNDLNRGLS